MKAIVMAAGVGKLLMPPTLNTPKPMVLIVNIFIIHYGIELLCT